MAESINDISDGGAVVAGVQSSPNSVGDKNLVTSDPVKMDRTSSDRLPDDDEPHSNNNVSEEASPSSVTQTTAGLFEEQKEVIVQALVEALGTQLEYYFSPTNLARDSFLRSVMSSTQILPPSSDNNSNDVAPPTATDVDNNNDDNNSEEGRHTPVIVLSRFGNIQKIVGRFETQRRQIASELNMGDDDAVVEQGSFFRFIPFLLRDATIRSSVLEVVVLTNPYSGPMYSSSEEYLSGFQGLQAANAEKKNTEILHVDVFRLGVGPSAVVRIDEQVVAASSDNTTIEANKEQKKPEKSTIILRDMPSTTTEEEIKELFSWDGCPKFKSAHSDVGNCWFVSLDGANDEIIDTLLALRSMKFKGEHEIKARLKTESVVKPVASNYNSIQHASDSNNGYSSQQHFDNNGGGGGARPQHYRRDGSSGGNKYGGSGGGGSSDTFGYRNRYQLTPPYNSGGGGRFAGRGGRHHHHRDSGDNSPRNNTMKEPQVVVPVVPPPPLEHETHFPALGGGRPVTVPPKTVVLPVLTDGPSGTFASAATKDAPSPVLPKDVPGKNNNISVSSPTPAQAAPRKVPSNNKVETAPLKPPIVAPVETKKTVSGYAAALLKAAAPPPPPAPKAVPTPAPKHTGKNNDAVLNKNKKSHGNTKTTKSSATIGADKGAVKVSDPLTSSLDDKLSTSSKKDSNIKPTAPAPPSTWGGKKSFAAILKRERVGGVHK